ncbi:MAG: cytochrome c-type biogenesis CcmF C-terminal domain-containing protein, partial [Pseudomonadota bacterium]
AMQAKGVFGLLSRESMLVANNLLLGVSAFVIFIGTIWPLVAEMLFDRKLSIGAPFFNIAFSPLMLLLGLVLPIGAVVPWKRAQLARSVKPLRTVFVMALAVGALAWSLQTGRSALGPIGLFLGAWLVGGACVDVFIRAGRKLERLRRVPRADWGKALAHGGLGITIAGVAGMMAWEGEDIRVVQIGDSFEMAGYTLTLRDVREFEGPNYISTQANILLERNNTEVGVLRPEKRVYPVAGIPTTEAALDNGILRDMYVVIGDAQLTGGWALRTYYKPLANWIWGGAIIMALGGALSLSDRRYRVAAGAVKTLKPAKVPAE